MDFAYSYFNNVIESLDSEVIWRKVFSDKEIQEYIITDLIQDDQLIKQGVDENDQIIGYYSRATELITNGRKKEGEKFNLKDTGAFYKSMNIEIGSDYFMIDADPIKIDETGRKTDLFIRYGEGIIGLTEQSTEKLIEKLHDKYRSELGRILYGY